MEMKEVDNSIKERGKKGEFGDREAWCRGNQSCEAPIYITHEQKMILYHSQ